jgi:hypothetical protein
MNDYRGMGCYFRDTVFWEGDIELKMKEWKRFFQAEEVEQKH